MRSLSLLVSALLLGISAPAWAQEGHEHHHPAPPAPDAHAGHAAMIHDPLMDRARAMGSGTALIPADSPMRMWSWRVDEWLWMAHGDAVAGANVQGGPRGAAYSPTWAAENWAMVMGTRPVGPGLLDLRLMSSLEPWTLPPGGTPQLFQTGETYQNRPLLDRQHPHDLLIELAARYTWSLDAKTSLFLYGGPVGEPAIGPSVFMHRSSAADNHWAPLGHHLQDSTHITYGVATVGARHGGVQLEGSLFNGREPDERRWDIEFGALDSWSTRLSWAPNRNWVSQLSYAQLRDPEPLAPGDVHRTTASIMNVQEYPWGYWSNALIWGQNKDFHAEERVLQSYGLESQLDVGANHLYGRFELVDKTGLQLTGGHAHDVSRVGALTLGGIRDLDGSDACDLGLGADATVYSMDADARAAYGFNPVSFRVYLRLRPPTMSH